MRFKGLEKSKGMSLQESRRRVVKWSLILIIGILLALVCFQHQDNNIAKVFIWVAGWTCGWSTCSILEYGFRFYQAIKLQRHNKI